ncbi:hypothetical protein AI2932V1_3058 [Klebsiella pneumoniae]|nr:hypothetical protein AI2932V1_3058 [Klebsiella pneumoniae]
MGNTNLNSLLKKETLIVALATALCYTGAYIYERGFSVYFGIPTELISVTPGSIITTVSLFLAFIMALYMISTIPIVISNSKKIKNKYIITALSFAPVWILFNLIFFLTSGFKIQTFTIVTIAYLFLCISLTISLLQTPPPNKPSPDEKTKRIQTYIDNAIAFTFFFSLTFFAITSGMGTFIARTTDNFNSFTYKNEEYKLIRNYGDNIIAIKIKDANKTKGVYIFKPEELSGIRMNQAKKHAQSE